MSNRMGRQKSNKKEPGLGSILREDLSRGDLKRSWKRDFKELKNFFLDTHRQEQLEKMPRLKRWFFQTIWLLKMLFLRLNPSRRIILLFSLYLILISGNAVYQNDNTEFRFNFVILGALLLLFILMLELKDKLLAREELEAGRAIQQALLPQENPEIPGWSIWLFNRPARLVGGDLLDFLKINEEKLAIAIGDVADKGLSAALLMAKLQSTLRAFASENHTPGTLTEKINRLFYREKIQKSFASFLYLQFSPNSGKITLTNAGHLPPIHIKNNDFAELPKGHPALGILPDTQYEDLQITLNIDEILFIYSDGLTEARNEQGEFFGEERLFDLLHQIKDLSSPQIGQYILKTLDSFIQDSSMMRDDLSLVILKRTA